MKLTTEERIDRYIRNKPKEFSACDVAKDLNLTSKEVAKYFSSILDVRVTTARRHTHSQKGDRYTFVGVQ